MIIPEPSELPVVKNPLCKVPSVQVSSLEIQVFVVPSALVNKYLFVSQREQSTEEEHLTQGLTHFSILPVPSVFGSEV